MPNRATAIRDFLRAKRDGLRPKDVGLQTYPGRRVPGLRREEVAQAAGMSVDYYTRLEQGRLTSASEGVILSLAEALHLSPAESRYLADLLRPPSAKKEAAEQTVRPALVELMNGMSDKPAFILGRGAEILSANSLLEALFTPFSQRPASDRNLLRWMLLDPVARVLYLDWEQVTSEVVGVLRAEVARHPHDSHLQALVDEFNESSSHFRQWWQYPLVVERTWGGKRFQHKIVGRVDITYETLTLPGDPDQQLFVYSPVAEKDRDALALLASWNTAATTTAETPAPAAASHAAKHSPEPTASRQSQGSIND